MIIDWQEVTSSTARSHISLVAPDVNILYDYTHDQYQEMDSYGA